MSVRNFDSSIPGVQDREIDQSVVPDLIDFDGPIVIGRASRGVAMQPFQVSSRQDFIEMFGEPTPTANFNDVWRDNQITGPTYGVLAALASLNGRKNLTYVRVLGTEHSDRTDAGKAGWKFGATSNNPSGGAYGLFLFPSGSNTNCTGTLAAIWYLSTGSITLSGTVYGSNATATGSALMIESNSNKDFRIIIKNESDVVQENALFNFSNTSDKFIRKVFNTNATRLNSALYNSSDRKTYFLGETYEDFISESGVTSLRGGDDKWVGVILALKHNSAEKEHTDHNMPFQNSQTGWFFAQDLNPNTSAFNPDNMTKLFKFHARDSGEWNQNNIKISISNIKVADSVQDPYGSFDVLIRRLKDRDSQLDIIERYNGCNLNPVSENYIARKIGDKYNVFDSEKRFNRERGTYDNVSKYIRVEVSDLVENGAVEPETLPFGVYGPVVYKSFTIASGTTDFKAYLNPGTTSTPFVRGGTGSAQSAAGSNTVAFGSALVGGFTGSVVFPTFRVRKDTLSGSLSQPKNAFFGLYTDDSNNKFVQAAKDLTRPLSANVSSFASSDSDATQYSWVFTLDDVRWYSSSTGYSATETNAEWVSGSRVAGYSITATGTVGYQKVLDAGFNSFTSPMFGGFDGFDIKEIEPLRNSLLDSATDKTSYAYNSIKQSIDILRDKTDVEYNILTFPGLTNESLTGQILDVCASRRDCFAIIDLKEDYQPRSESSETETERLGNITSVISSLKSRGVNTSYGACWYPWLVAKDSLSNQIVAVPPSVPVLGCLSINDKVNAEWDAPAGINRGNLSDGDGGIEIIGVKEKIYTDDQKRLYEANINPIIKSVKHGIVIWGQKTLQFAPKNSALSRINVRRAMIAIRKSISRIAESFIFEPNLPATWAKFLSVTEPVLADIKSRFGLKEYKILLDERTTTPDLIDRNIIYAKIFVKPTITAENIFLDFTLTNQSVDFATLE